MSDDAESESQMDLTGKVITVGSYMTGWEANLACNKLRAEGVPAAVIDENFNAIGYGTLVTGPARVQVREQDLEQARQILASRPDYEDDVEDDDPRCPRCGATTEPAAAPGWLLLISIPLFGLPYVFAPNYWRCIKCGRRFAVRRKLLNEQAEKDRAMLERLEERDTP